MKTAIRLAAATFLIGAGCVGHWALGNGGPFVVKDPHGDPAAKGVLARLDPTLKPAQETRLRVVKEDLTVCFAPDPNAWLKEKFREPPVAEVTAAYQIENPTAKAVTMDFGFPILRGIYLKFGMIPYPDMGVQLDKERVYPTVISNSMIYGIIRENAREVIEKGLAADPELAHLTAAVRAAWTKPQPPQEKNTKQQKAGKPGEYSSDLDLPLGPPDARDKALKARLSRRPTADYLPAKENLRKYLTSKLAWNPRDAALLGEYAGLDLGMSGSRAHDRWYDDIYWWPSPDGYRLESLKVSNLGPLAAIGEQKATQLFAQLALRFDERVGTAYETIFSAWGGDVRERSLDLATGKLRPRELALSPPKPYDPNKEPPAEYYDQRLTADPTVYARIDYLDPNAKITKEEKTSCLAILKNLPVVFTFAPMNLLYYQATFAPHSTRAVTVRYRQYAYADTRGSGSYQLAYVLHPATLWKEFGPIRLTLQVPKGVDCKASAAVQELREVQVKRGFKPEERDREDEPDSPPRFFTAKVYQAVLDKPEQKRGELFVGVDKAAWDKMFPPSKPKKTSSEK